MTKHTPAGCVYTCTSEDVSANISFSTTLKKIQIETTNSQMNVKGTAAWGSYVMLPHKAGYTCEQRQGDGKAGLNKGKRS